MWTKGRTTCGNRQSNPKNPSSARADTGGAGGPLRAFEGIHLPARAGSDLPFAGYAGRYTGIPGHGSPLLLRKERRGEDRVRRGRHLRQGGRRAAPGAHPLAGALGPEEPHGADPGGDGPRRRDRRGRPPRGRGVRLRVVRHGEDRGGRPGGAGAQGRELLFSAHRAAQAGERGQERLPGALGEHAAELLFHSNRMQGEGDRWYRKRD